MVNDNYNNFTTTSPNKGFYEPDQPENQREEREEGKGEGARKKRLATVLSFYIGALEIVLNDKKTRPSTLTNAYLGRYRFQNPDRYIYLAGFLKTMSP